jgi:hypothetical protein
MPATGPFVPADEGRHQPGADTAWSETWVFDAWSPDATTGVFTWLTLRPAERRTSYWSVLVRPGHRQVYVADVDVALLSGLVVRTTGLWADHTCEAPFEQWTVRNECHAVALDDGADALGRAYGELTAVAVDMEWYATGPVEPTAGGYRQPGEAHTVVELAGGPLALVGPAARTHVWGTAPPVDDTASGPGATAYLPGGGVVIERRLTPGGWRTISRSPLPPRPSPSPRGGA